MSDPMSDVTFRPQPAVRRRRRRDDDAWEAVVREELLKLRRRSTRGPRVVPVSRETADDLAEPPPTA